MHKVCILHRIPAHRTASSKECEEHVTIIVAKEEYIDILYNLIPYVLFNNIPFVSILIIYLSLVFLLQ